LDDSDSGASTYNKFEMGKKNVSFDAFFMSSGQFTLFLTMGYGASAKKYTRLYPTYYNPEFNRKAAWKVEVIPPQGGNPPDWGNTWDDKDTTTLRDITIKVYDWQHTSTVAPNYPDPNNKNQISKSSKVSMVSAEVPGMTVLLKSVTVPTSGTGTVTNPLIYKISMANEKNLPVGLYYGLVKVTDGRIPPSTITPGQADALINAPVGAALAWYSMPEFATYQIFPATVVPGIKIVVTSPNGFENWPLASSQNVTWNSFGTFANVKIDLSTNGGAAYPIPITASAPNSGTYNIPSVGAWTSGHCRIRVANAADAAYFDISDHDFSINCPLPVAPTNVSATDGTYSNKVIVTWFAVPGALSYNVYRDGILKQSNIAGINWTDTNTAYGVIYYYQVEAVNSCGEGPEAPPDPGEPGNTCILPLPPTGLTASDGTYSDHIALKWNVVLGVVYNIFRNGVLYQSGIIPTSWDDYGINPGVIYSYEIQSQNSCGPGNNRSNPDSGYIVGCATDNNNACTSAVRTTYNGSISGCVDMIDGDWYHFYMPPNGFTNLSTIIINNAIGTLDILVYGIDPGGSCPGTLISSLTNVGLGTVGLAASTRSHVYVKLIGHSGLVNYDLDLNFKPSLTNIPVEIYVATTTGTSSGTWPTDGSTPLTHAALLQMMAWANNIWNQYGYNLAWDQTETFVEPQYYSLNYDGEDWDMHHAYGYGKNKLCMYFVDQLFNQNTAYCYYREKPYHVVNDIFSVYSTNVWSWQDVIAHEHGHGIGYLVDTYLFDMAPCTSCACGDNGCLSSCLGYPQILYADAAGCYDGNLMYFGGSHPWSFYTLTSGQINNAFQFHYEYPGNFPWY